MFLRLFGSGMAAFLDFSAGMFIACVLSVLYGSPPSIPRYIIGGLLALAPDADVLYSMSRNGKLNDMHHEIWAHRPLIVVPIGMLFGFLAGDIFWASIAGSCLLGHYLHDTEGLGGGGIAWFWPFSRNYYSPTKGGAPPEQSLQAEWNGRDLEWFSLWFRPSALSLREIGIGSLFFSIAIGVLWGFEAGVLGMMAVWGSTCSIWILSARFISRS